MRNKLILVASLSLVSQAVLAAKVSGLPSVPTTDLDHTVSIIGANSPKRIANEYIVIFKDGTSEADIEAIRGRINQQHRATDKPLSRFSVVNGIAGKISKGQIKALTKNPFIESIEVNKIIKMNFSSLAPAAVAWGIDRIDQQQLPLDNSFSPAVNGSGVHVYVIDTGISTPHSDFNGRAVWDFSASTVTDGNDDRNGHGTHIAGTIGGSKYGVANNVTLHAVKVFNNTGVATLAGIIEGVDYVTNNHHSPAVATIGVSTSFSQALNNAVAASTNAGVSYAVPVGDNLQDACNYSPASATGVIAVAASDVNDKASSYSNKGSCVDIYAPGLYIKSTWITNNNANNTISHSPMAAAHVAGAAALIRGHDSTCNVAQVKQKLLSGAQNGVLSHVPNATVNKLLNVSTSIDVAEPCNSVVNIGPIIVSNDESSYASTYETKPIYGDERDNVVAQNGKHVMSWLIGIYNISFNVQRQGQPLRIRISTADHVVTFLDITQDGFTGIHSDEAILSVTFIGADGLVINQLANDVVRNDIIATLDKDLFEQTSNTTELTDVEDAPIKDVYTSSIGLANITVTSPFNVGVSSPNMGVFPVDTVSVLTSDGNQDEDFTIHFKTPARKIGFTNFTVFDDYATVTVTTEDNIETVYRPTYNPMIPGFLGFDSSKKIKSIRWQSPWTGPSIYKIRSGIISLWVE
jgi:subtilisin family serine protease